METPDHSQEPNECEMCLERLAPQVRGLCERWRDLLFGSVEANQALADYYEHRANHPGCDCP